jgi:plasmid stabilization system protein ParE
VIRLSPDAQDHVDRLIAHYEARGRLRAAENLLYALDRAKERIGAAPGVGLDAPRPYPELRRSGRYWIAYNLTSPPVIAGVFYVTADIPNRV